MFKLFFPPRLSFAIVILIAIFFSFWKLGSDDLNEWDESEYGVNAFEMMHNGDYINYYYAGKPDTINAKPPLFTWLVILCYKIFGLNAFALRLTSAISSCLFFVFAYKIIRLYGNELLATISCLILLSSKSILGQHIGRTGDTDALLIFFLTISVYYFLLYIDFGKRNSIFLFAVFSGFAFYTKGTAAFVLLPGLILYSIISGKWKIILFDFRFWLSFFLLILITGSWLFLLIEYGNNFRASSFYGSSNAIETLFRYDTLNRLTSTSFETDYKPDRTFFFRVLDTRLNLWNYFLYLSVLPGILFMTRNKKKLSDLISSNSFRLIIISACLIIPLSVVLTLASFKHNWYLAPIFLFIAVIIGQGILNISQDSPRFIYLFGAILIFTLFRQFVLLNTPNQITQSFFKNHVDDFKNTETVRVLHIPSQNFFLYLNWYSRKIEIANSTNDLRTIKENSLVFYDARYIEKNVARQVYQKDCFSNYCIATTK